MMCLEIKDCKKRTLVSSSYNRILSTEVPSFGEYIQLFQVVQGNHLSNAVFICLCLPSTPLRVLNVGKLLDYVVTDCKLLR